MANYCSNCGNSVSSSASFCSNCGVSLNQDSSTSGINSSSNTTTSNGGNILGTLVAVSLFGGITRQLYYYNGRYFLDPYCRNPFIGPRILGHHRPMGGIFHHPVGPRGGMRGGHRGGPGRHR